MQDLSADELSLLAKLGISLDAISKTKGKGFKGDPSKAPVTVSLEGYSGTMTAKCVCCESEAITLVDFVKRADAPGHAIKTVLKTTHKPTIHHKHDVFTCNKCEDSRLANFDKGSLINMVINLKKQLKRRIK
jgi:hypothetical protein